MQNHNLKRHSDQGLSVWVSVWVASIIKSPRPAKVVTKAELVEGKNDDYQLSSLG